MSTTTLVKVISLSTASAVEAIYTERFFRFVFNQNPVKGACFKHAPTGQDIQVPSVWEAEELPEGVWDGQNTKAMVKTIRF